MYKTYKRFLKERKEKTPLVSIIATAINPETWRDIYNRFSQKNITPFEMIFVGPNPPIEKMPKNFIYIKTNVKPTQCMEIAARKAKGDFIFSTQDDSFPLSLKFLSFMTFVALKINNDYCIHAPLYKDQETREDIQIMSWRMKNLKIPLISQFLFISRKIWIESGGIDKNFVGTQYEIDIELRMIAKGGYVSYNPMCIMCNPNLEREDGRKTIHFKHINQLAKRWRIQDSKFLDSVWLEKISPKGRIVRCRKKRFKPVDSFSDVDILTKSQGPSDPKWD